MKKELILIGGGGHCKSCIDVIESEDLYSIKGIIDSSKHESVKILGYEIIGDDRKINELIEKGFYFLVTVGQIKTSQTRNSIFQKLVDGKAQIATIYSPSAQISRHSSVGEGTIVMHSVNINASAVIGKNSILNSGALIEHDVTVGSHVHVSTHAILNGNVIVGDGCFVGSNAVIGHGIKVVDNCIIGAGTVVVHDLEQPGVYVGNPARLVSK